MAMMDNVSRPLIALLVGALALFAVWFVALKPSSSGNSAGSSPQSAVKKAQQAVQTANSASAAHGGTLPSSPSQTAGSTAAGSTTAGAPTTTQVNPSTTQRLDVVSGALKAHKVLAVLFYNPAAADDQAVKQELASIPTHGSQVVKLVAPIDELAKYTVVTAQVPVNASPTLVLIDSHQRASTIVGFADRFEIAQRVSDALTAK
jgi:hypothetical protein